MYWESIDAYGTVPVKVRCPSMNNKAEFDRCRSTFMVRTRYMRRYLAIYRNPARRNAWINSQLSTSSY